MSPGIADQFTNVGIAGAGLLVLGGVVRVLFVKMMTSMQATIDAERARATRAESRSDSLEEQLRTQNNMIQDRFIKALVEANTLGAQTLELIQKRGHDARG